MLRGGRMAYIDSVVLMLAWPRTSATVRAFRVRSIRIVATECRAQLHHWLRTVLVNQRNQKLRNHLRAAGDLEIVSLDARHGWTG
jgi:hypothetical protein